MKRCAPRSLSVIECKENAVTLAARLCSDGEGVIRFQATVSVMVMVVAIQLVANTALVGTHASAQATQPAMIIIGEKSRDACEVQSRRSDGDHWGGQSIEGPPRACEGGLVSVYRSTEAEAQQEVARRASSSASPLNQIIRVVRLTGNSATNDAAIEAEINSIHQAFDPGGEEAMASEFMLGYLAPEAVADALPVHPVPSASVLAAKCKNGQPVGTHRREDWNIKADGGPDTRIHGFIHYKRISCKHWRILDTKMWMTREPVKPVWFRRFQYTQVYRPMMDTPQYVWFVSGLICDRIRYGSVYTWHEDLEIKARGSAQIEVIDEHHILSGEELSCEEGAGTSYVSGNKTGWFRVPGGTK